MSEQYRSTSPTPIPCRSCVGPTPFCSETSPTSFRIAVLGPTSFRHRGSVVHPQSNESICAKHTADDTVIEVMINGTWFCVITYRTAPRPMLVCAIPPALKFHCIFLKFQPLFMDFMKFWSHTRETQTRIRLLMYTPSPRTTVLGGTLMYLPTGRRASSASEGVHGPT